MQDTNNIVTNSPNKGLVTDLHENLVSKDIWTHARNAQMNSHLGQLQFIQNEPSNKLCVNAPYTIIGAIKLLNNKWAIFSTDNYNSEIGIFNELECTYVKVVNDTCLNFNTANLIEGRSKELFDCSEVIYWTDGVNKRRYLNLSNVPFKFTYKDDTCSTKVYTKDCDCEELWVDAKLSIPSITPRISGAGSLKNGAYQFSIAYSTNNFRITEFTTVSKPVRVWSHENRGQAVEIDISNLDSSYDQFELAVIYTINEVISYKSLGFYNINTNKINISNVEQSQFTTLTPSDIFLKRPRYPYASLIASNDQYLLWGGMSREPELNYQAEAMNIKASYVVYQVPKDYYANGGVEVGYERDEVYAFGIQWLYKTGEWSPAYHIPGRKALGSEIGLASGPNVYETELKNNDSKIIKTWQVKNTASKPRTVNSNVTSEEKVIATGTMGYWESDLSYPNNPIFGEAACTKIRHHLFPDNAATHIHNGDYINLLGVKFENIEHPKGYDGKYNDNIVGYRIVRADRKNDRSVIAKGLITNVRSYNETDGTKVMYPNYPYNDLREDTFLSTTQVRGKAGAEQNFIGLTEYSKDKFNFYGPHSQISDISFGNEIKILKEEVGTVTGQFKDVYKHPRAKLLTQFDLYFALIIGALDGYYAQAGKVETTKIGDTTISLGSILTDTGVTPPQTILVRSQTQKKAADNAKEFTSSLTVDKTKLAPVERVLRNLAKAGIFAYFTLKTAQEVLNIISESSPWQSYAMQYNSVSNFTSSKSVDIDDMRRQLAYYQYVRDGLNTVEGVKFNNYKREKSVYIRLGKEINDPKTVDNTRGTITDFNLCDNKYKQFNTKTSAYYTAIKKANPSQYGNLEGIRYVDCGYLVNSLVNTSSVGSTQQLYKTDTVFGGDTFINTFSVKRNHNFFSQSLHDVPDGFIYDYRLFRNVAYPRYFIDTTPYDISEFISLSPSLNRTPANKHNLNCGTDANNISVVKNRYFYLSNNGVLNFFVESDYNLDCRDWKESQPDFYSKFNSDPNELFRSDKLGKEESYIYDKSLSKEIKENSIISQQYNTFDPTNQESCQVYNGSLVVYSQQASIEQKGDNWLTYLPLNYYRFSPSFGNITSMKSIDNQQVMFLFDKSSPYVTVGRDELKLDGSGKTITLGDGGLFAREPRPIAYTDFFYGNSQSQHAFLSTQYGVFYPSQRQGRLFKYAGQLQDITQAGMDFWFTNYLPSALLSQFPNFKRKDNTVNGVGLVSIFDNNDEIYYLSKVDYKLKAEFVDKVKYNEVKDKFYLGNLEVKLTDTTYFENASWTISYNPKFNMFVSFHDWNPGITIQSEQRFFTTKGSGIWKHNDNYKSFCNFYGENYPFEFEYLINNGNNVEILKSIEYYLDYGKFFNEGRDFHTILDGNFDELVVSNNEQSSGTLKLFLQSKKDLRQLFDFPQIDAPNNRMNILYNKEEQKYRINQFFDLVLDRGEFSKKNIPLWITDASGYKKEVNNKAINLDKAPQQRKKFRSLYHKILLKKLICGENKLIFKFANAKESVSFR